MDGTTSPGMHEVSSRPMRADAVKNRALVLKAAEEIFAEDGLAVPVDEVAKRAGVGVGTLYRHFPTKEALFEAIVVARVERLLATANQAAHAEDAGAALFNFLRDFSEQAAAKRDLVDALGSAGIDFKSRCSELFDELMQSIDDLLLRAVSAGAVRNDVNAQEIVNLIAGTCHACNDEKVLQHLIGVVLDGLQKQTTSSS